MRKVVQISTAGVENTCQTQCNHITTVLCEDGSIWELRDNTESPTWVKLPDIPHDPIDDPRPYRIVLNG